MARRARPPAPLVGAPRLRPPQGARRCHRRRHRRPRRAAAGPGLRDLVGTVAAGGHLHRDRGRRADLAARRLAPPDRRPHRRLRRHRRWHRRRARRRGAVHLHADGRRDPHRARGHRHGIRGPIHPAARRGRVHQRHCRPHRQHADSGFLRPDSGDGAQRFPAAPASSRGAVLDLVAVRDRAGGGDGRRHHRGHPPVEAHSRPDRRARPRHADRGVIRPAGRDHRHEVRRYSIGTSGAAACRRFGSSCWPA